mmetsp:Transcript_151731/g.484987  ORF Transcript_151731/g.484987 Transcript_151731/m.484987 type:complete len:242 (+) Transcript_151731:363-1088(+)
MRRPRGSHAAAGGATAELSVSASSTALGGAISSTSCPRRCVGRALGAAVLGNRGLRGHAPDASDAGIADACSRWESPAEAVVELPSQVEGANSKSIGMATSRQNSLSNSSSTSGRAVGTTGRRAVRCAVADGPFSDPSLGSARATAGVTVTSGRSGQVWACSCAHRARRRATRSWPPSTETSRASPTSAGNCSNCTTGHCLMGDAATMLTEGLSQPEPELAEGQMPWCRCSRASCNWPRRS